MQKKVFYDTQLGRYIVYMERQPRQRRMSSFFCILCLENMSIQQVTVVVFYRPQNGTFLVLTTGVVTYTGMYYCCTKESFHKGRIVVYIIGTVVR